MSSGVFSMLGEPPVAAAAGWVTSSGNIAIMGTTHANRAIFARH
jgi:hypothetical protein